MLEDAAKRVEFFNINLGGNAYWQMLKEAGHSKDEIRELVNFHMMAKSREVIDFMGGQALYDSMPAHVRDSLFVLSTLRYLCDSLAAWKPAKLAPHRGEHIAPVSIEDGR